MIKIGCFTCAALLVLGSCTNEISEEGFVDKANTISFSAYASKTRAESPYSTGDVNDIATMKTGSFGVVGYTSDNNLYLGAASKAIEQVWDAGHDRWDYETSTDLRYWPDGNMDFYAYFPYSASGDVFAASDASGDVMTITNTTGNQDVLFAREANVSRTAYVPLHFRHAFAKIKSLSIQVKATDVAVTVSKVEFLNTSTKGKIKVDNTGNASYAASSPNVTRVFDLSSVAITHENTEDVVLFDNDANGYVFATNSALQHYVTGTGKSMWDGNKSSITGTNGKLSESDLICLKLTCKVKAADHYLVGSEGEDGEMYIPVYGTSSNSATISEFLAGRRYTYKIVMESNVGYKDTGDPIMLAPIRFSVNEVPEWNDVTVTINL